MDDIDELISNEMNSKNGTKSSTQQVSNSIKKFAQ